MNRSNNILLAIVGLSPAIITEALYFLIVKQNKKIDEVHIITTQKGKRFIIDEILGEEGAFKKFCKEYNVNNAIKFNEKTIYVAKDEESVFLDDITTTKDNTYFPNLTFRIVNLLTDKMNTTIYACLSGGRKTMSFYLGAAMMRFGRKNDVLFHVLVEEKFQKCHPKFYYPTLKDCWATYFNQKNNQEIKKKINFKEAEVVYAEIPFIRLREKLPQIPVKTPYEKAIVKDSEFLELIKDIKIPQFKDVPPKSKVFKEILIKIKNLKKGTTILLLGETGTGKELIARYISEVFESGEIVVYNLARSANETLFKSELFGYKKGAFTGADQDSNGYIDYAKEKEAVLFLDEVDKVSIETQNTLLRFLENREYRRVGDALVRKFEGTIVLAGNIENFDERRAAGEIMDDFYYRILTHRFDVPPLRERQEDILPLTRYYILIFNERYGKNFNSIDDKFEEFLYKYNWPGNIRELMSFLENIIPHHEGKILKYEFIPKEYRIKLKNPENKVKTEKEILIDYYENILKKHRGNASAAARELELPYTTFISRLKRLGINHKKFKTL